MNFCLILQKNWKFDKSSLKKNNIYKDPENSLKKYNLNIT